MADVRKELVAASSRPIVLSILAEGESYGYAIIQRVKELSGGQLDWTEGMLYPVLHRMQRDGLIAARWRTADGGRRRRYYHLNQKGTRVLAADRQEWTAVTGMLNSLWGSKPCPT